jgi:hypothetical protein
VPHPSSEHELIHARVYEVGDKVRTQIHFDDETHELKQVVASLYLIQDLLKELGRLGVL